jgi:hypothetical protein
MKNTSQDSYDEMKNRSQDSYEEYKSRQLWRNK